MWTAPFEARVDAWDLAEYPFVGHRDTVEFPPRLKGATRRRVGKKSGECNQFGQNFWCRPCRRITLIFCWPWYCRYHWAVKQAALSRDTLTYTMGFEMFRVQGHWAVIGLTLVAEMSRKPVASRVFGFRQPFDFVNPLSNIVQPPDFVKPVIKPPLVHQPIIDSDAAWWHGLPLLTRHNGLRVKWGLQRVARQWFADSLFLTFLDQECWKLTRLCGKMCSIIEALLNLWQSVANPIFLLQLCILQWSKKSGTIWRLSAFRLPNGCRWGGEGDSAGYLAELAEKPETVRVGKCY